MNEKKPFSRKKLWTWVGTVTTLIVLGVLIGGVVYVTEHPLETVDPSEVAGNVVTAASAADLLYAFDRPAEPIFTPRGLRRDVAFHVPVSYLPERYVKRASEVRAAALRAGVRLIAVPELDMPAERFADVDGIMPFRSPYTRSAPPFLALSIRFWHFFSEGSTVDEVLARVVWARLHFNPEMVLDALLLYMLRSPIASVKDVLLPELPQYFPELYVDDEFFAKSREEMHLMSEESRVPVPVIRNLSRDDEAVLWYFREDPHFHVFHWKWHVYYPAGTDDVQYVDLPRRGELFVHLHRQFTARYNAERFTNGLPVVLPLDIHKPLPKGYFPKMTHLHGAKGTVGRQANTSLLPLTTFIEDHDKWVNLYEEVLKDGYVDFLNGSHVKLEGIQGLDIVSNFLEGNTVMSPNYNYYGNVHNALHANLARAADPLKSYNEPLAVTSYITTTAKDPAFFNIHMLMDNLYEKYKTTKLTPYSVEELTPLPGVTVQSVSVRTQGALGAPPNRLSTYWQQSDLDVSMGLDYTPTGRQYARFTHLQHRPFEYQLKVLNNEAKDRKVFVRLFLLMIYDENNSRLNLDFRRRFSIQMDIFDTVLRPGMNEVRRASTDSALTVDTDAVYTEYPELGDDASRSRVRRLNVCRCGWPQGLLLPRGTVNGTEYELFAMVTDYEQDRAPVSDAETCRGWLMCGVPGSTHYPDARAMGFPLDRPFRDGVRILDDFLTQNMAVADVRVVFEDATQAPTGMLPGERSTSWMPTLPATAQP